MRVLERPQRIRVQLQDGSLLVSGADGRLPGEALQLSEVPLRLQRVLGRSQQVPLQLQQCSLQSPGQAPQMPVMSLQVQRGPSGLLRNPIQVVEEPWMGGSRTVLEPLHSTVAS